MGPVNSRLKVRIPYSSNRVTYKSLFVCPSTKVLLMTKL
jgi:hypothetical protein